jgi:hypothetical protein
MGLRMGPLTTPRKRDQAASRRRTRHGFAVPTLARITNADESLDVGEAVRLTAAEAEDDIEDLKEDET